MCWRASLVPLSRSVGAAWLMGLSGCGSALRLGVDEDRLSYGTCTLVAEVSGSAILHFTGEDPTDCATGTEGTGLFARFLSPDAKSMIELQVEDIAEGTVGSDLEASVSVYVPAVRRWRGKCLATLSEQTAVDSEPANPSEDRYEVSGRVTCPFPLHATARGNDTVTVEPFSFQAEVVWRE